MNGRKVGGWHWQSRNTAKRVRIVFLFVLVIVALILSAIGGSGCSRSAKTGHSTSGGGANSPTGDTGAEQQNELAEEPDPAIMSLLMEELERQLAALPQGHNPIPQGYGRPRAVGYEADYSGVFSEDQPIFEPTADLWLIEGTIGDYDGNAEVGVPDITPIALNYLKSVEYLPLEADEARPDWNGVRTPAGDPRTPDGAENWRLAQIDGDGNGEIGISDVTPIALHFGAKLEGWRISIVTYEEGRKVTPILPEEGEIWVRRADGGAAYPYTSEISFSSDYLPGVDANGNLEDGFPGAFTFEFAPLFAASESSFGEIAPSDLYANVSCPNPADFAYGRYLIRVPLSVLQIDTDNCLGVCAITTGPMFDSSLSQNLIVGMYFEAGDAVPRYPLVPFELGITVLRDFEYEPKLEMFENLDGNWSSSLKNNGFDFILEGIQYAIAPMPSLSPEDTWWRVEYVLNKPVDKSSDTLIQYMRGIVKDSALLLKIPYRRNKDKGINTIQTFVTSVPLGSENTKRMRVVFSDAVSFGNIRISQQTAPEVQLEGDTFFLIADIQQYFPQLVDSITMKISPLQAGDFQLTEGYFYVNGSIGEDGVFDISSYPLWITRNVKFETNYPLSNYDPAFLEYGNIVIFREQGSESHPGFYADGNIVICANTVISGWDLRLGNLEENGGIVNLNGTFPIYKPGGQNSSNNPSDIWVTTFYESNNGDNWTIRPNFGPSAFNSIYSWVFNSFDIRTRFVRAADVKENIPEMSFFHDENSRLAFIDYDDIPFDWRFTPIACKTAGAMQYEVLNRGIFSRYGTGKRFVLPAAAGFESLRLEYLDKLNDLHFGGGNSIDYEQSLASSEPPIAESAIDVEIGSEYSGTLQKDSRALIHAVNSDGRGQQKLSFRVPRETVIWFWKDGESGLTPFGWSYDGAIYQEYGTAMPDGFYIELCALPGLVNPEGEPFTITVKDS